jgi:hypothetical protein
LNLSGNELQAELAEIEELEGVVKRRMMGNIRFIGELFKKGIIKNHIMHECLHELLFGKAIDEQELELVCKLLRTVGEKIDMEKSKSLDAYFVKLYELSRDTRFNIRIRFSVEEIINLRQNNWQERRAADGPALIEEIRTKAANEELMRKQQSQPNSRPRGRGHPSGRGSPHDVRGPPNRAVPVPDKANQRRPSIPSTSPDVRPRSNSSDFPATSLTLPGEVQERQQLPDEAVQRRVKSIVEEYLNLKDVLEATECLLELPESACGQMVDFIIGKYLDAGKPDVQRHLIALLKAVMPQLCAARESVEESLRKCEPFLFIVDILMDIKQVSTAQQTESVYLFCLLFCRPLSCLERS